MLQDLENKAYLDLYVDAPNLPLHVTGFNV